VTRKFERYAEASREHDLAILEALTADDIVWQLERMKARGVSVDA
jgi:hypothetical protein